MSGEPATSRHKSDDEVEKKELEIVWVAEACKCVTPKYVIHPRGDKMQL